METKTGLSVNQIFELLYDMFKKKGGCEIKFKKEVLVEIANDSDHHKTNIGYSSYDRVLVLGTGSKKWGICLGKATGQYPAHPFNCDIAIVAINNDPLGDTRKEVSKILSESSYFKYSPIFGMADGAIGIGNRNVFGSNLIAELGNTMDKFIAKDAQYNREIFTMDGSPVVISQVLYKEELAEFFFKNIEKMFA